MSKVLYHDRLREATNLGWRSASLTHFMCLELLSDASYNWLAMMLCLRNFCMASAS